MEYDFGSMYNFIKEARIRTMTSQRELQWLHAFAGGMSHKFNKMSMLDLGTYCGASAIMLASGARWLRPDNPAIVWTIDNDFKGTVIEALDNFKLLPDLDIRLIKGDDLQYLSQSPDNNYNVIFIDGQRDREHVKQILDLSIEKADNIGIICGHDYAPNEIELLDALGNWLDKVKSRIYGFGVYDTIWWCTKR